MEKTWFNKAYQRVLESLGNDASRDVAPSLLETIDYTEKLNALNADTPVGVYIFSVNGYNTQDVTNANVSRNNFIEEMREEYGNNFITVDVPQRRTSEEVEATYAFVENFVNQFNKRFAGENPVVHVVANHHQNQYNDRFLAQQISALEGTNKRALILACGPNSSEYQALKGFEYVVIPRPDGQLLAPELDSNVSPAYRYVIGWMRDPNVNTKIMKEKLEHAGDLSCFAGEAIDAITSLWKNGNEQKIDMCDSAHIGSKTRDLVVQWIGEKSFEYLPPIVLSGVPKNEDELCEEISPPTFSQESVCREKGDTRGR